MIRHEVKCWLHEAEADLNRCERAIRDHDFALACFLAHQCIEKALKALIIHYFHRLERTRDLTRLYSHVKDILKLELEDEARLCDVSQYYVTTRYPNAGIEMPSQSFTQIQAETAYQLARKVLDRVRQILARHDC